MHDEPDGLDLEAIAQQKAIDLLRKADPWQAMQKSARAIGPAMKKLARKAQA